MGRSCFLCDIKANAGVTLHRFPHDEPTRALWYKVCNLYPFDNVANIRVCWLHFTPKDYSDPNWKQLGIKPVLLPGAVPSRKKIWVDEESVPLPIAPGLKKKPIDPTSDSPSPSESAVDPHFNRPDQGSAVFGTFTKSEDIYLLSVTEALDRAPGCNIEPIDPLSDSPPSSEFAVDTLFNSSDDVMALPINGTKSEASYHLSMASSARAPPTNASEAEPHFNSLGQNKAIPRIRTVAKARCPSELAPEHLTTLKEIKKVIHMVKSVDQQKTKEIKRLQGNIIYLKKKVTTLKRTLLHLRKKIE